MEQKLPSPPASSPIKGEGKKKLVLFPSPLLAEGLGRNYAKGAEERSREGRRES